MKNTYELAIPDTLAPIENPLLQKTGYCNRLTLPSHSSHIFDASCCISSDYDVSPRQTPGYLALPGHTPWTPTEWRQFHEHPDRAIENIGKIWPASLDPGHLGRGGQRIADHEACLTRHPPEFPIDSGNFYKDYMYEERGTAVVGAIAIDSSATLILEARHPGRPVPERSHGARCVAVQVGLVHCVKARFPVFLVL